MWHELHLEKFRQHRLETSWTTESQWNKTCWEALTNGQKGQVIWQHRSSSDQLSQQHKLFKGGYSHVFHKHCSHVNGDVPRRQFHGSQDIGRELFPGMVFEEKKHGQDDRKFRKCEFLWAVFKSINKFDINVTTKMVQTSSERWVF